MPQDLLLHSTMEHARCNLSRCRKLQRDNKNKNSESAYLRHRPKFGLFVFLILVIYRYHLSSLMQKYLLDNGGKSCLKKKSEIYTVSPAWL